MGCYKEEEDLTHTDDEVHYSSSLWYIDSEKKTQLIYAGWLA